MKCYSRSTGCDCFKWHKIRARVRQQWKEASKAWLERDYVLRQAEAGTPVADVCRGVGISEATFYVWKKKYAGLGVSELRRLKLLEDELGE